MVASLVLLAILGLSPIGNALIIPLEQRFPPWDAARGAPDGIVVLGGAITPDVSSARSEVALNESAERLTAVAELARRYPEVRIVFSGGSGALLFDEGNGGGVRSPAAGEPRHPAQRVFCSRTAPATPWKMRSSPRRSPSRSRASAGCLVTSAYHMPRSIGVFRAGRVSPSRRIRSTGARAVPRTRCGRSRPLAMACRRTDTAVREWVGLVDLLDDRTIGGIVSGADAKKVARARQMFAPLANFEAFLRRRKKVTVNPLRASVRNPHASTDCGKKCDEWWRKFVTVS